MNEKYGLQIHIPRFQFASARADLPGFKENVNSQSAKHNLLK